MKSVSVGGGQEGVNMKKINRRIPVLVGLLALGIVVFLFLFSGKRPFQDLDASEITSAIVRLVPPDKTIQITDISELAEYLRDVVVYNKDNSYTKYSGQGVIFTLTMSDGTQTKVMAYNPFLVLDGVGYKTEYDSCQALNSYANRLLEEENAIVILEEPPVLNVILDDTCHDTLLGIYSWRRKNSDGTFTDMEADSAHPLDCKELLEPFETTETTAVLRFAEEPDTILNVCCWSDGHWLDSSADSEDISVNGNEIELKPGGYIYEVTAEWDAEKSGYGGTARYSFYVEVSE